MIAKKLEGKTYGTAARKAGLALTTHLESNGDIREVCEGTNKTNSREFYLNRRRDHRRHARPGSRPLVRGGLLR